ncbi:MAG: extracellular elastinolytic metalloproteinase [Solirubrobacteraceae bacterium]|nr:extracellular elastinolytic metalloproteinase [Solirubrobacteraceae bacterium]
MTRLPFAPLAALIALLAAAPAAAAAPVRQDRPLPNTDVRGADGGPATATERRSRAALERALGDEGVVSTDRVSGGARLVARTDGFLTGRRAAPAAGVALDYVRAHPAVFGLADADLGELRLTSRYRTPDGVTHLAYAQTHLGIAAYDNVLLANVDADGRLLNVGGSAVPGIRVASGTPGIDAETALAQARRVVGGPLLPPAARQGPGPERPTRFAGGDSARLTLLHDGTTTRLAWALGVTGAHDYLYELVVDAATGAVLKRRSLTELVSNASVYENFPGAPAGGAAATVDLAADASWLNRSAGNTRLFGNNAEAYVDAGGNDAITPVQHDDVPASAGGADWLYPLTMVPGQSCPPPGCTWDSGVPATRTTNREQATTQLFYYVNRYHDHLAAPPIDFISTARNFEFAGPLATSRDPVQAETDNYLNDPDGPLAPKPPPSLNNSSMSTPPDGSPPVLQTDLFAQQPSTPTFRSLNAADTADVVYHEYTHGLTNRSVGSGVGLDANQSRAMGEGWSDWYALDFLESLGLRPDAPSIRGEMNIGGYLVPGGLRTQGADCPVGTSDPACPGTGPGNRGGYTLGDMSHVANGFEVHADGEIWLETLWDIRAALGSAEAERLVTAGLRLSPNNPSFLEERDAILLADRQSGGADYVQLWTIFARRGMGYGARITSAAATTATEAFDLPPRLAHESTTVSDPAPGGDGDDVVEPGETASLVEELRNPRAPTVGNVTGVLTTSTPQTSVSQPNATWPNIPANLTRTNAPPLRVAVSAAAACDTTVALNLALTTDQGGFSLPLQVPVGSKLSDDLPKVIPAAGTGVDSTLTFSGPGTVQGMKVRIARLEHTFVGDLVMTLTSPTGTTVTLMDSPGTTTGTNHGDPGDFGASGNDLVNLVLEDGAATPIEGIDPDAPGPFTGSFRPDRPLAAFNGEDRQGAWILHVFDKYAAADSGTLQGWGLRPSTAGCANSAPIAVDDSYAVAAGQTLAGDSVLRNDTDADHDTLTAVVATQPAHGALVLAADGTFTYTPDPGFRGTDAFTYRASDASALSPDPARATIVVGNNAPVAADDGYAVAAGATLGAVDVLANDSDPDGDPLTAALTSRPGHGTADLAADGTLTYTPQPGFTGADSFAYVAGDATTQSAPATVTITVSAAVAPPPPPPAAAPRAAAKIQVLRAGVSAGKLDVLASITARATGSVRVTYRSAGTSTSFDAPVGGGRIRFRRTLPRAQRSKPTGIFTLRYAGTSIVAPDSVTLRAANGKARLARSSSRIDTGGILRAAGTISPRARGIVRVRLAYAAAGHEPALLDFQAKIAAGRWSLAQRLPPAAALAGGQLSIQFTGYEPLRIRGEQLAKEVAPGG